MRKSTFVVVLVLAAVLVAVGVALQGDSGAFSDWLASLHGRPRH
jgi:hypothetical protein